jgi:hypothetical protein
VLLGFVFDWGALGLWMGVAGATSLQAVALHVWVALGLDWRREVRRSAATVGALLGATAAAAAAAEPEAARSFAIPGLEEDDELTEEGEGPGTGGAPPSSGAANNGLSAPLLGGRR